MHLLEWNLAPPRRANTIIMTDANGRTGLDYAQAANDDKNTDWKVVGDCSLEITTASGKEMVTFVIKQDFAWATLGGMATRPLSLCCPLRATGSTALLLGRNDLTRLRSKLAMSLVRVFNSARSMIMFRFMSDSRLRDVGEEVGRTLHAQGGTMLRYVGQ